MPLWHDFLLFKLHVTACAVRAIDLFNFIFLNPLKAGSKKILYGNNKRKNSIPLRIAECYFDAL